MIGEERKGGKREKERKREREEEIETEKEGNKAQFISITE